MTGNPKILRLQDPIVIVGAGIGGLAAGIALRRAGFEVEIYERARELREVGAGVALLSNAMAALDRLALGPAVRAAGAPVDEGLLLSWSGSPLSRLPFQAVAVELGLPRGVGIHRGRLQKVLVEASAGIPIHTDCPAVSFEERLDHVALRLDGGREVRASLLIGADGVRSVVRGQLHGDGGPRHTGSVAWRGLTANRGAIPQGSALTAWGRGRRVGIFEIEPDRVCWYIVSKLGVIAEERSVKEQLLAFVKTCGAPLSRLVESTPEEQILRSDLLMRPFSSHWGQGRVTLLGDAAHPMVPTLAQGAAQAIEDAVVLAEVLSRAPNPFAGLRQYEEIRIPRTRLLVEQSLYYQKLATLEGTFATWFRDRLTALTPQRLRTEKTRQMLAFGLS